MVETDWRQILSFSQKELNEGDKEKLCESLSWMEADDIELNFSDLKTLFRLAQDILKYKSEQVNSLLGQLETSLRKNGKKKSKAPIEDSPARSSESAFETISHQEEIIKANKDILEQLYADIAELEERKGRLEKDQSMDRDSESSRDAMSEINEIEKLEHDVTMKNRHIRKLLKDVKVLEEENVQLKEKTSTLKDKLNEATQIIENLTEQLLALNAESAKLKEALGKAEKAKVKMHIEIQDLRKRLTEIESSKSTVQEEIHSKILYWKNVAQTKKIENDVLSEESQRLKESLELTQLGKIASVRNKDQQQENQYKELQEKLMEATNKIIESAELIEFLESENVKLKDNLKDLEIRDNVSSVSNLKNESDDVKERIYVTKLKKKIRTLSVALQGAEEMITEREKELTELTAQLHLLQSGEEGLSALIGSLKSKKRQLKLKDEGIKTLVQEVNSLHQAVDDLQLENFSMRRTLNLTPQSKVETKGILKKYQAMEQGVNEMVKDLRKMENRLVTAEVEIRNKNEKIVNLTKHLSEIGYGTERINQICESEYDNDMDGGGDAPNSLQKTSRGQIDDVKTQEMKSVIEENEGLRKGLQEILDFLKDNSNTSSGVLALQCPTLEAVLQSMEARHSAGWFAPHMTTILELRAALGGRDALLTALHEARKETFDVMMQLNKESQKSQELESKLHDIETKSKPQDKENNVEDLDSLEFGTWVSQTNLNEVNFNSKNQIEVMINEGNLNYENQLKNSLAYFHSRFKLLFDKMTAIAIQAADDQSKWSIQEEQYKAEIENLKSQLTQREEDDKSDDSPGLIGYPSVNVLQRKCTYLEESYKYLRTLTENVKNEYLESKKESMIVTADYEIKIQRMILYVSNITDQLRNSINVDLFWKQHEAFNDIATKYKKLVDGMFKEHTYIPELYKKLESDKMDLIGTFQAQLYQKCEPNENYHKQILSNVEQSVLQKQVERLCLEVENYSKKLKEAESRNSNLQETQSKMIDASLTTSTKKEVEDLKERLEEITEKNKMLKEQCQHVTSQLDIALIQLQDKQQRQMSCDMEINMLRHQILDLQSVGDSKAIVARLSGEILVAHLQASESHAKIERLNSALTKEIQRRLEAEDMLKARENIFNIYACRYESKFKYMYEVMHVLRQQYHGCLPIASVEKYLNDTIDISRKSQAVDEKLNEIEDLRLNLLIKQSVLDDFIERSKAKCIDEDDSCPHKIKLLILQGANIREVDHYNSKIQTLEKSWADVVSYCNSLEKTLILVNQGFEKPPLNEILDQKVTESLVPNLELEDIQSDDEDEQSSRRSETLTLPKPQLLKTPLTGIDMTKRRKEDIANDLPGSPARIPSTKVKNMMNAFAQTTEGDYVKKNKIIQTETDREFTDKISRLKNREKDIEKKEIYMNEALKEAHEKNAKISKEINQVENTVLKLQENMSRKDIQIEKLETKIRETKCELEDCKKNLQSERAKIHDAVDEENKSLMEALNKIETEKNGIVDEYKSMLQKERDEYLKSAHELNGQIRELKIQLERKETDSSNTDAVKEVISKYSTKTFELEDKCFKLQSELDSCRTDISTYQSEAERWKELATERLYKMEQLSSQLEERHCQEVDSYKAENQHWLSQLSDTQKEHIDLRNKMTEQKTLHMKQLAEKDAHIEQLRSVIQNLKAQIMNMQAMLSVNDPSFDLSAIVEVDDSDTASLRRDQLEIRFESTTELHDDIGIPSSSSTIWQEPVVERLRREKQLSSKQNNVLRRQIKALASRERRARLEAQNLKNQIYRISTSGSKAVTAETVSLQAKIAALQTQLASARRDTQSSIALWDKMKRAQQSSERWQARFEEKCREVKKIETSLNYAKSAIARLEKEKRVLLTRTSDFKHDKHSEKQDHELSEKARSLSPEAESPLSRLPPHITTQSLLDRIEAQQRRIAALELAEKGNEPLVSEYEKSLAEITSLKGQVLRLESTLLESQIRSPLKSAPDPQPELEYWKSYCDMLKEENMQLSLKLSSVEAASNSGHHHKINDLEKTVLTLRGLVSKLQAEQKSSGAMKRQDSKLSSGFNFTDKNRSQLESYRIEISNLKRSIVDKDNLLEKSKEMLRIAAEREDELLNENAFLRRQLNDILKPKPGFVSV